MLIETMNPNASTAGLRDPKRVKSKLLHEESILKRRLDKLGSDRSFMLKYFHEEKKKFERKLESMNTARYSAKARLEESKAQLERRASAQNRGRRAAEPKPVKVHTGLVPPSLVLDPRRDTQASPHSDSERWEADESSPEPLASESDPDLTRLTSLSELAPQGAQAKTSDPIRRFTRVRSKSIDAGQLSKLSSARDMNTATADLYRISKRFSNIPLDDIIEVSSDIASVPDDDAERQSSSHLITKAWLRDLPIPKDALKLPEIKERPVTPSSPRDSPTLSRRAPLFSATESTTNPGERSRDGAGTPRSISRERPRTSSSPCGSPTRRVTRQPRIDLSMSYDSALTMRECSSTPRDISPTPHPRTPVPSFSVLSPKGELVLRSPNPGEMDFLKRALSGNRVWTSPMDFKRRPSLSSDECTSPGTSPGPPSRSRSRPGVAEDASYNILDGASSAIRPSTLPINIKADPRSPFLPKSPTIPGPKKTRVTPDKAISRVPTENNLSKSNNFGLHRIRSHDDDVRALTPIRERSSTFSGCSNTEDNVSLCDSG